MERYSMPQMCIGLVLWVFAFLYLIVLNWKFPNTQKRYCIDIRREFGGTWLGFGIANVVLAVEWEHSFFHIMIVMVIGILLAVITFFVVFQVAEWLLSRKEHSTANANN